MVLQTADVHIKQQAYTNHGKEEDRQQLLEIKKELRALIGEINYVLDEIRYQGESGEEIGARMTVQGRRRLMMNEADDDRAVGFRVDI